MIDNTGKPHKRDKGELIGRVHTKSTSRSPCLSPSLDWKQSCVSVLLMCALLCGCSRRPAIEKQLETQYQQLGKLYAAGEYRQAIPLAERVLVFNEKTLGAEHPNTATCLNNLGELYRETGNYAKAESAIQRGLLIREKVLGPEDADTALSLESLAILRKEMGDYAKAEPLYQRALGIREKVLGPDHPDTAKSLINFAEFYDAIGAYAKAEPLLKRSLAIHEKVQGPDHRDTAASLINLASLYYKVRNYSQAEPLFQRALGIYEKVLGPEHPITGTCINNLAELYERTGNDSKAESFFLHALQIHEKAFGPEHPETALGLNNLALLYREKGEYVKAEPLFQRALGIYEKVLGPEHPTTVLSRTNLGWLELDIGNIQLAHALAVQSATPELKAFSNILSFGSEQERLIYRDTVDPYMLFAAIDGSDSELALACLQYKGVVLDSIIEDRLLAGASRNKEEREMVQTLGTDKQKLGQLLLERPRGSANQTAKEIQQLEQEVEQIEGKLARHVASLGRARRALSVTVPEVQAVIPGDGALIEYLLYRCYLGKGKFEPHYGAVVLTAKEKPRWVPLGKADEIDQGVRRYRNQISDRDAVEQTLDETLRASFQQLLAPVEQVLPKNTRTVIVSPDGQLNFVSFATLLSAQDRFLAEDYFIQYVSSGRDLLREVKLAPNSQLIAFGNPDFGVEPSPGEKLQTPDTQQVALRGTTREALEELELSALPGTKAECAMLAERCKQWGWRASRFLSTEASEAELRRVRSPHILHLATHGFFVDVKKEDRTQLGSSFSEQTNKSRYFENPMHRAGLALAGAQATLDAWKKDETPPTENDGIVTAEEVSALKLEGTWLVTLSACNTGYGEAKSGEGVLGLRRGFIKAGAQNLLMTLWPISDETTVDIMSQFYAAAHKSGNAPRALAEVQRDWLVKLRKTKGLVQAVNLAGPFILSSQGKPDTGTSK